MDYAGYTGYHSLILRPSKRYHHAADDEGHTDFPKTAGEFKAEQREALAASGKFEIVMTVGDQESDFYGGFTGFQVKLPNRLYVME